MDNNPTGMELCPHCGAANVQGRGLCYACDRPLDAKPPASSSTHQMQPCAPSEIFRKTFRLRRLVWRGRFIATVGLLGVLFFASGAYFWPWEPTACIVFPGILMSGAMLWLVQRLISEVARRDPERIRATLQALKINHVINLCGGGIALVLALGTIFRLPPDSPLLVLAIILAPTLPALVFNFMQISDINKAHESDLPLLEQEAPGRLDSRPAAGVPLIYLICGIIALLFTGAVVLMRDKIEDHSFLNDLPILFLFYAAMLSSLTRWWRKGRAAKLVFLAGLLGLTAGIVIPLVNSYAIPSYFPHSGPMRAAVERSILSVTKLQTASQCLVLLFLFAAIYSTGRKGTDPTVRDSLKPLPALLRWAFVVLPVLVLAWKIQGVPWGGSTWEEKMGVLQHIPEVVFWGLAVLVLLFGARLPALAVILTFSALAWFFFSSLGLQSVFQDLGNRSPGMWQFWLSSAVGAITYALLIMAALWDHRKKHQVAPPVAPLETTAAKPTQS